MNLKASASCAAFLLLTTGLAGCATLPPPGPAHYGRCGHDAHLESYPYAHEDRRAYGCKSDDEGFLEGSGQGDQRRN
jgi:hypothetical protein